MTDKDKIPDLALLAMSNPEPEIDHESWKSAVDRIDRQRLEELLAGDDSGLDALFSGNANMNTLWELGLIASASSDLSDDDDNQSNVVAFDSVEGISEKSILATGSGRPVRSTVLEVNLAAMTNSEDEVGVIKVNAEAATSNSTGHLLELEKLTFENGTVAVIYAAAARNSTYVEFFSEPKALDLGEGPIELDTVEDDEKIYRLRDHTVMKVHQLLARIPKE